jgi:hypothetical protein
MAYVMNAVKMMPLLNAASVMTDAVCAEYAYWTMNAKAGLALKFPSHMRATGNTPKQ